MLLWFKLAEELAGWCCTSAARDCKTVASRVEHEGSSFLTITLPQFCKGFERGLEQGYLDRRNFTAFSFAAESGLPKFLSGFLGQVFDASSGLLLDTPSVDAIRAVRQLTLLCGKQFKLPNQERENGAMYGYVKCDEQVRLNDAILAAERDKRDALARMAHVAVGRALHMVEVSLSWGYRGRVLIQEHDFSPAGARAEANSENLEQGSELVGIYDRRFQLVPSHGPGATADGLKGNQKWQYDYWPKRLSTVFHPVDYAIPNYSYYERLDEMNLLEPEAELPVRVVSVPKTQKTPRIIAIEPTVMMFMQQALKSRLYEEVERDNLLSAFIGFEDQSPNQRMALEGSSTGELATLDLSEASDRVSCLHVEDLCRATPALFEGLMAVRSTKADVQGHGVITLAKYASMGSALTFPIEAMLFLCIVLLGIEKELNKPLKREDLYSLRGKVRVYGDDIIVPVDYVRSVIESLESYGLVVNHTKSFWTGKFRESCGKEYYDGVDVSVVRVRQDAPTSWRDAREVISWVAMSNQFFKAGLWQTVKWLDSYMAGVLTDYPVVAETSPALGRYSFCGYEIQRVGGAFQAPLVKGFVEYSVIPANTVDDHYALHKWLTMRGELPFVDVEHLERSGRPSAVSIKRRWVQPF